MAFTVSGKTYPLLCHWFRTTSSCLVREKRGRKAGEYEHAATRKPLEDLRSRKVLLNCFLVSVASGQHYTLERRFHSRVWDRIVFLGDESLSAYERSWGCLCFFLTLWISCMHVTWQDGRWSNSRLHYLGGVVEESEREMGERLKHSTIGSRSSIDEYNTWSPSLFLLCSLPLFTWWGARWIFLRCSALLSFGLGVWYCTSLSMRYWVSHQKLGIRDDLWHDWLING